MRKIFPAIIILMLFVTGCSKVDSKFVGMWRSQWTEYERTGGYELSRTFTILPDGNASYGGTPCHAKVVNDLIILEGDYDGKRKFRHTFRVVKIYSDALSLTDDDGNTRIFKRL